MKTTSLRTQLITGLAFTATLAALVVTPARATDPGATGRAAFGTRPLAPADPAATAFVTARDAARSELILDPDPGLRSRLPRSTSQESDWGGAACPPAAELRSLVDDYLSTPNPAFPALGSTIPGLSVSWSSDECGVFVYAAGSRSVEDGKALSPATLMGIASMTKAVIAAVTLRLDEAGLFGPTGLETTVDQLLTPGEIAELTVGDDPSNPRCPGSTFLLNRATLGFEWKTFSCPNLSRVTIRHLMLANHGMYDYINEVLLPNGASQWEDGVFFELYEFLGLDPMPPISSTTGFEYLKAFGLKANNDAVVGGNLASRDLEISFGNTGFQLLGGILERRTGKSLDALIRELIVEPLGIDAITIYVDPARQGNRIADGYEVYTGEPLIEDTGIYPVAEFNGHTAVNTLSLGLGKPGNISTAGGAGGLIANMKSYRAFLDAMVNGDLLGAAAKAKFESSFYSIPDLSTPQLSWANGFGLAKLSFRSIPGSPDFDVLYHPGRLPGIRCENGVVRLTETDATPFVGALCINANTNAYPGTFDLLLEFVRTLAGPGTATGTSEPALRPSSSVR